LADVPQKQPSPGLKIAAGLARDLFLPSPAGDLSYDLSWEESANEMAFLKQVVSSVQTSRVPALRSFVERMYLKTVDKAHLEGTVKSVQATSEDTGLALLLGWLGFRARLEEIQMPALVVISGKNSRRETIAAKAKELKRGEVHVLKRLDTRFLWTKPDV
jgi:cell division protein FtsX